MPTSSPAPRTEGRISVSHVRSTPDELTFTWGPYSVWLNMKKTGRRLLGCRSSVGCQDYMVAEHDGRLEAVGVANIPTDLLAACEQAIKISEDPRAILARALEDFRAAAFELQRRWQEASDCGAELPEDMELRYSFRTEGLPAMEEFEVLARRIGGWTQDVVDAIGIPH